MIDRTIKFSGYAAGHTDFAELLATAPQPDQSELSALLDLIVQQLVNPETNRRIAMSIVGHADRQDRADFTCDQRRQSESDSSRDRTASIWEWIKREVNFRAAIAGHDAGQWWETSPHVTVVLFFSGAAHLQFNPPTEEQRPLNRRVTVHASVFE